jgi:hypothetical protein
VVAPIINGFIAWVVGYYNGPFETWKIIFLLVGALTVVTSVVVYFVLYDATSINKNEDTDVFDRPNNPLEAKFLTSREKYIVIQRKAADNTGIESKTFKVEQLWEAIFDIKTWLIWIAIAALQVCFVSIDTSPEHHLLTLTRYPMAG